MFDLDFPYNSDGQISNRIVHVKSQIFKHKISNLGFKSQSEIFRNTQITNLLTPKSVGRQRVVHSIIGCIVCHEVHIIFIQ